MGTPDIIIVVVGIALAMFLSAIAVLSLRFLRSMPAGSLLSGMSALLIVLGRVVIAFLLLVVLDRKSVV